MKYAWIEARREEFEVVAMCRVLDISPSGFYAWCQRGPSARALRREELLNEIKRVHAVSRGIYGSRMCWPSPKP